MIKKHRKIKCNKLLIIQIIIFIIAIILISIIFQKVYKKEKINLTSEILRSREYETVKPLDENTQSDYVTFDAFFLKDLDGDDKADAIRGTCNQIGKEDTLYMELKVNSNGYLKNGKIIINSSNFYFNTNIVKDLEISNNYISSNTKEIKLNNIQNGTQKFITGTVRSGDYLTTYNKTIAIGNDINNYSKINNIIFTGTHVADDGITETQIYKKINFYVDWYGTAQTLILEENVENEYNDLTELIEGENINLSFKVQVTEDKNELLLKTSYIEGTIPQLNGFAPLEVNITGTNIKFEYDSDTRKFSARSDAILNENGIIINNTFYYYKSTSKRLNEYIINITYPKEAYSTINTNNLELLIPVTAYHEAYNNSNKEFQNPYKSKETSTTIVATWRVQAQGTYKVDMSIGKYVSSPYNRYIVSKEKPLKIYNEMSEEEIEDYYIVEWKIETGTDIENSGIVFKEHKVDNFIKTDSESLTDDNITFNKGIYFSGAQDLLGEDGWIKVYDDEKNQLLETFTSKTWNNYYSSKPYYYKNPIKRIRIETSIANINKAITIYNIKEIDDTYLTKNYKLEEFQNLEYIKSHMTCYFGEQISEISSIANYEAPMSIAKINLNPTTFTTQETTENAKIKISLETSYYNEQKWKNGSFLIKMPKTIIDVQLNNIKTDNNEVTILGYDLYEENEQYFIKILTTNESEETYNITVDCNLTPNPIILTTSEDIELYAINEVAFQYYHISDDIYDVDEDLNKTEKVNYSDAIISLISPNSLLTSQVASNYDIKETKTIAPKVAKVDKNQRTANIEINLTNNYTGIINDVIIQGVIPFKGNKYIMGSKDLGSTFDTYISNTGIQVPKQLEKFVTIYYSENPEPNNDLSDSNNGWVKASNVQDWNKIKTYAISLGDYELQIGESQTFSYEINIPEGINYNETSYSEHAIYFSLQTEAGKYKTSTATSKLGFMIAKQYNLEIQKLQKNSEKYLPGITFTVQEKDKDIAKICTTNSSGVLEIKDLLAEKTYIIKEILTTDDYVLLETPIIIYTYIDENDNLVYSYKTQDGQDVIKPDFVKNSKMIKENEDYKLQIVIENQVKAQLKLIKYGETTLKGVQFTLRGKGKQNVLMTTDENGQIEANGLFLNEIYTLKEIRAEGYYKMENEISFKITSSVKGFELEILSGEDNIISSTITTTDEIPIINLNVKNEKIPTYSLCLTKYKKDENIKLEGAQYIIYGDGISTSGAIYTTDKNGTICIDNLYEYVDYDGKPKGEIVGEYTIKEIFAPEGYSLDSSEIKFKAKRNVEGILEVEILSGQDKIRKVNGVIDLEVLDEKSTCPTIAFSLENSQIFELTKIDGETFEPLPGAKFNIYSLDEIGNIIDFAKDINGNYVGIMNVVTTNELGKVSIDLPEGIYKVVEIEAPKGYELPEKEEDRSYYFSIGSSKPKEITFNIECKNQITAINESTTNNIPFPFATAKIKSTYATKDGGLIAVGFLYGKIEKQNLKSQGGRDGLILKYNSNGEIEWSKSIGGTNNDEFYKVIQTQDSGYVIAGYISSKDINIDPLLKTQGLQDGIIIKLDSTGNYVWGKTIGGNLDDNIYSVIEDNNSNLIVTGGFSSNIVNLTEAEKIINTGETNGFILAYSNNGSYKWHQKIDGNQYLQIIDVSQTDNGYVVAVNFIGAITIDEKTITSKNSTKTSEYNYTQDGIIIGYDNKGNYQWHTVIGGQENEQLTGIITTSNGDILVYGNYASEIILNDKESLFKNSNIGYDVMILKFSSKDGNYKEKSAITFGGSKDDLISQVIETKDGGLLLCGYYYSPSIDINGDGKLEINKINGDILENADNLDIIYSDAYIIKLDKNNNLEFFDTITGKTYEEATTVTELKTNTETEMEYVVGGWFDSQKVTINGEEESLTNSSYNDSFIIKYQQKISEEIPQEQNIIVKNNIKQFKITTEIASLDQNENLVGGNITGKYGIFDKIEYSESNHIKYVENVKYNKNSLQNICIEPDKGYVIKSIKINGIDYEFFPDENGNVILPIFENVLENKHIVVEFSNNITYETIPIPETGERTKSILIAFGIILLIIIFKLKKERTSKI